MICVGQVVLRMLTSRRAKEAGASVMSGYEHDDVYHQAKHDEVEVAAEPGVPEEESDTNGRAEREDDDAR